MSFIASVYINVRRVIVGFSIRYTLNDLVALFLFLKVSGRTVGRLSDRQSDIWSCITRNFASFISDNNVRLTGNPVVHFQNYS